MEAVDYKALCRELFGTMDEARLRELAKGIAKVNGRGAGRKNRFTASDVKQMRAMLQSGRTYEQIAAAYGTTRQTVSRYLNHVGDERYTMRMSLMHGKRVCTVIDVDFLNREIAIENRTDDILHRAFGKNETPSWADFEYFLRDRCFPEARGNRKEILAALGLESYDPMQIIEKTGGRMAEDSQWIKLGYRQRGRKN